MASPLSAVPRIVTAHAFCSSRDTRVSYGWWLLCAVKTFRGKQNLANAFGI